MLFNLPLPGGVTGYPVGVGIATIVLGPWQALLSIPLALTIQAVFFGDGGITAPGANCFNMAIAGSFAAWAVYRLLSSGATTDTGKVRWQAWALLLATVTLTPLGVLAGGAAWGEWSPSELLNQHGTGLSTIPFGLARLNHLWSAPIANYAPQIGWGGNSVSYAVAALAGVSLILALFTVLALAMRIARSWGSR